MVSKCGFAGAIGFVNVECGITQMNDSRDSGYVYMELVKGGGTQIEGGLLWLTDIYNSSVPQYTGLAPYYRSTFGPKYENLNNRAFHYGCNQNLVIAHGMVYGSNIIYTYIAQTPSDFDPRLFWASGWRYMNCRNPSWNFHQEDPAMNLPGTDAAGVPTPCRECSISRITSLAQNGGERNDGSYFGEYDGGGQGIHWMQVAFGNWLQGCGPNAQFCTLKYSRDHTKYYGGEQFYYALSGLPAIQLNGPTDTGYGPWETYDGIGLQGGPRFNNPKRPRSAFTAPLPDTCTGDSYGYCILNTINGSHDQTCADQYYGYVWSERLGSDDFYIEDPNMTVQKYSHAWIDNGFGDCQSTEGWYPSEPSVSLGDPNLP